MSDLEKFATKIDLLATKSDLNQAIANLRSDMFKLVMGVGLGLAALHIASVAVIIALLAK